jgi:enoyl-CoA hydratase
MSASLGDVDDEPLAAADAAPAGEVVVARDGEALRVTINRPEKRNPLSRGVLAALRAAFALNRDDPGLKLAVVTAAGDKSFAAGGDLREVDSLREREPSLAFSDEAHAALEAIRTFPLPVVAALNGDALGGGAELAVACDIRLIASHARIGFIQGRLNIATSWGGGTDLMQLVGFGRGLSLLSRSAILTGPEALAHGLVEAVAPAAEPFAGFVEDFVAPMRRQTPLVMRGFKAQALARRLGLPRAECRALEREHFAATWLHDDHWAAAAKALAPRPPG